jgi:putative ABC transport system permease protein
MWYDFSLAWRNITSRKIQSLITILVVSLAFGLLVSIAVLADGIRQGVLAASDPFGVLVIGPPGSAQQLILSNVLLQGVPQGTIPVSIAEALAEDERVASVVPLAMGDNVGGARVIGTTEAFFALPRNSDTSTPAFSLAEGRLFSAPYEAVLGARVAQELGLRLGDYFVPSHGLEQTFEPNEHGNPHQVVGILAPSHTPFDHAILVSVASVWAVHGGAIDADHAHEDEDDHAHKDEDDHAHEDEDADHAHEDEDDHAHEDEDDHAHEDEDAHAGHDHAPGEVAVPGQLTAVFVVPTNQAVVTPLWQEFLRRNDAQAAFPGRELGGLFDQLRQAERLLTAVGYLAAGMATLTMLLAMYSATAVQAQQFAILRGLGASRLNLVRLVLFETLLLSLLGALLGRLLGYVAAGVIASNLAGNTAVGIPIRFLPELEPLLWLLPLVLALAAGLYPAIMAYRVDVVAKLFPN